MGKKRKKWARKADPLSLAPETKYGRAWLRLRKHYQEGSAADMSALSEDEQRALVILWQDVSALLDIALRRIELGPAKGLAGGLAGERGEVRKREPLSDALRFAQEVVTHQVDAAPGAIVAAATIARKGAWKDKQVQRSPGATFPGPELRSPFEEAAELLERHPMTGDEWVVSRYHLARVLACCGVTLPPPNEGQGDGGEGGAEDPESNPSGN